METQIHLTVVLNDANFKEEVETLALFATTLLALLFHSAGLFFMEESVGEKAKKAITGECFALLY